MKLVQKLAMATLMLSVVVPVQFAMAIGEPIADPSKVKNGEPVGPAGAAISTTRSNIKRPGKAETAEANSALGQVSTTRGTVKEGEQPVGPAGAPVNTSRSNKRQ